MRDDEIVGWEAGFPMQGVGVNELDASGIQSRAFQTGARGGKHPGTGIHDGNSRGGEFPPACDEEAAVAFARDQDVLRGTDVIKKCGAAAL